MPYGQSWEDWLYSLVEKKAEAEVVQKVRKIMNDPVGHFAPARKQLRSFKDFFFTSPRRIGYNELRDKILAAGGTQQQVDKTYFGADYSPSHIPYRNETHVNYYDIMGNYGHWKEEDAKHLVPSFAYPDYEDVPAKVKNVYVKGPARYNFARKRNLGRRASNRQAIIRLSKGRYHPY